VWYILVVWAVELEVDVLETQTHPYCSILTDLSTQALASAFHYFTLYSLYIYKEIA